MKTTLARTVAGPPAGMAHATGLSRRACTFGLAGGAAFAASPVASIGRDPDGRPEARLENGLIRVHLGWRKFRNEEGFVTSARLEAVPGEEQADDRIDAAANRGAIRTITPIDQPGNVKTVRLEWNDLSASHVAGVEEISIRRGSPALRIEYFQWPVNIVDIGSPGGARSGEYAIHGDGEWKRKTLLYPSIYFDRHPGDAGYQNIVAPDAAGPLDCGGWFVMGVFNPANGRGFGRVAPVEAVDIIKLLHGRGFELFPYYKRTHVPFVSYLFFVTGGRNEILEQGRALAREGWK